MNEAARTAKRAANACHKLENKRMPLTGVTHPWKSCSNGGEFHIGRFGRSRGFSDKSANLKEDNAPLVGTSNYYNSFAVFLGQRAASAQTALHVATSYMHSGSYEHGKIIIAYRMHTYLSITHSYHFKRLTPSIHTKIRVPLPCDPSEALLISDTAPEGRHEKNHKRVRLFAP